MFYWTKRYWYMGEVVSRVTSCIHSLELTKSLGHCFYVSDIDMLGIPTTTSIV